MPVLGLPAWFPQPAGPPRPGCIVGTGLIGTPREMKKIDWVQEGVGRRILAAVADNRPGHRVSGAEAGRPPAPGSTGWLVAVDRVGGARGVGAGGHGAPARPHRRRQAGPGHRLAADRLRRQPAGDDNRHPPQRRPGRGRRRRAQRQHPLVRPGQHLQERLLGGRLDACVRRFQVGPADGGNGRPAGRRRAAGGARAGQPDPSQDQGPRAGPGRARRTPQGLGRPGPTSGPTSV